MSRGITIKKPAELALIRAGGKKLAKILADLGALAKPGVTTKELEEYAEAQIKAVGGRPAFKGYGLPKAAPFLTTLCVSINEEIVHAPALPERPLKDGDLVGIDIGMEYPAKNGFYNDTAITVGVGKVSREGRRLIAVTRRALALGIKAVRPGALISDISQAVEKYGRKQGVGIVRDLVGHGVGYAVHEDPAIPNYYDSRLPPVEIKEGMVLAIEPMFTLGDWRVVLGKDGWTIKSVDNSLAAHFEHTVIVTKNGAEIVTRL